MDYELRVELLEYDCIVDYGIRKSYGSRKISNFLFWI